MILFQNSAEGAGDSRQLEDIPGLSVAFLFNLPAGLWG